MGKLVGSSSSAKPKAVKLEPANRSETQEALADGEGGLRSALAYTPFGVALIDLDGRFLHVNEALANLLGRESADLVGVDVMSIVHPDDREATREKFAELQAGKIDHTHARMRCLLPTGQAVSALADTAVVRDDIRQPLYLIIQVQDVVARLNGADEAQQLTRLLTGRSSAAMDDVPDSRRTVATLETMASIVESSQDAIITTDLDGNITSWNPGARQILGYAPEEVMGRPVSMLAPPAMRVEAMTLAARARDGATIGPLEVQNQRKDGSLIDVSISIFPLKDGLENIVGTSAIVRDITERRHVDETRQIIAAIVDSSDDAIIGKTPEGIITSWNAGAARMFGYTAEEAVGRHITMLMPPGRMDEAEKFIGRIRNGEAVRHFETARLRKDGSTVVVSVSCSPVKDPSGCIVGVSTISRDVSERVEAEAALQESEERFRAIAEAAQDAVVLMDTRGNISFWNRAAERIFGYTSEDVIGSNLHHLIVPPRYLSAHEAAICRFMASGQGAAINETLEVQARRKDGSEIDVELSLAAVSLDDGRHTVGIVRDTTERKRAADALRESEERFGELAAHIGEVFWLSNQDFSEILYVSPAFEKIWGRTCENLYADASTFLEGIHPDDREQLASSLAAPLVGESELDHRYRVVRPDGSIRWIWSRSFSVRNESGEPYRRSGVCVDVTNNVEAEAATNRYRLLAETASDIVLFLTPDGTILDANEAAISGYGYERSELIGMSVNQLRAPGTSQMFPIEVVAQGPVSFEALNRRKDGSVFPSDITLHSVRLGAEDVLVGVSRDVSQRKQLEEDLTKQAFYDKLTELPNRSLFMNRLEHALAKAARKDNGVAVLFIDIDGFKVVNDSLGHAAGDRFLLSVASRLQACVRLDDTVSRFGGDEFAIIADGVTDEGVLTRLADRILRKIQLPIVINGQEVLLSASIGIAQAIGPHETADELLRKADLAMYESKGGGKAMYSVYHHELTVEAEERLRFETELRRAIENQQFRIYYQPVVLMASEKTIGFEALVRWQHPRFGLMPPDEFIPMQEKIGLIEPFTLWVLGEAQRQCLAWHAAGHYVTVSVNLSARNLMSPDFPEKVSVLLRETDLAPSALKLEITESAVMLNPAKALRALQELCDMGVRLSMDDFGTGYSSLSYLKQLPVQEVKIDKSFIIGMDEQDEDDAMIVRATIELAHNLRKRVVAEGVETEAAWNVLKDLGCDAAQGFYMGRPMPGEDVIRWLTDSEWGTGAPVRARIAVA